MKWCDLITVFIDNSPMDSPVSLVWSAFSWFAEVQDAGIPKTRRKVLKGIFVFSHFGENECAWEARNALKGSSFERKKDSLQLC